MSLKKYANPRERVRARPGAPERIAGYRRELAEEITLTSLRRARDFTQEELARALDTTQSGISRIEHQTDLYLSTLRKFVEVMGGQLQIQAVFPDADFQITSFSDLGDTDLPIDEPPAHSPSELE